MGNFFQPHSGEGRALRLFFALWPDAPVRSAIAARACVVAQLARGRTTRDETLHLTLAFVGDTPADRVPALVAIGEAAAGAVRPFTLALDLVGGFRDARVAWLGVEPVPESLAALAAQLRTSLAAKGFPIDRRPFAAHVTLARSCRSTLASEKVPAVGWKVDRLALVASELGAGGSRYRTLTEWPLAVAG